jgi:predicted DNA-binding transcriptional regulator YafY
LSSQGTIRRYTLVIEKIKSQKHPSFAIIRDYLSDHGFEISTRTLQRDIEQIRLEFGIEIKYDRSANGYFIDEEESLNLDSFLRFLEIVATANLLTQTLKDGKDSLKFISFESEGNLKGIENLQAILFAIKNHRVLFFKHYSYTSGRETQYHVNPIYLKNIKIVGIFSDTQRN